MEKFKKGYITIEDTWEMNFLAFVVCSVTEISSRNSSENHCAVRAFREFDYTTGIDVESHAKSPIDINLHLNTHNCHAMRISDFIISRCRHRRDF